MAPPAFVAPPAAVAELVGASGADNLEPPKVVRATVDLSSAAREAGLAPAPPPIVQTPPPGLLTAATGAETSGMPPDAAGPTPAMGLVGLPADPMATPNVVEPPRHLGIEPAPPPMVGGPAALADATHGGGPSDAATLDSPWLKAPPPAPVVIQAPLPEPPAVVVAAPIRHAPSQSRTWIVAIVAVLILVAGAVAVLSTRGARPADDAPLKMDAPTSSPRHKGADDLEPVAEPATGDEPAKPVGTGLPPVGPAPNAPPGGFPQGPRPKPTATTTSTGGAAKPPPAATTPKFDPSTI